MNHQRMQNCTHSCQRLVEVHGTGLFRGTIPYLEVTQNQRIMQATYQCLAWALQTALRVLQTALRVPLHHRIC